MKSRSGIYVDNGLLINQRPRFTDFAQERQSRAWSYFFSLLYASDRNVVTGAQIQLPIWWEVFFFMRFVV